MLNYQRVPTAQYCINQLWDPGYHMFSPAPLLRIGEYEKPLILMVWKCHGMRITHHSIVIYIYIYSIYPFFCLWKPCVHPMIFENLMIGSYLDRNPATAARGKPGDSICILMGWRGLREMSMSMANYNLSPYVDWLVVCNIWIFFPIILAISSSQLTKSYFSEG